MEAINVIVVMSIMSLVPLFIWIIFVTHFLNIFKLLIDSYNLFINTKVFIQIIY
jgi:hypothetical protein